MAERWQQWMPFHIDRWKGSPHVQAMRAAARAGYLYLLATAWQTDYCCLPDDDEELMVLAGLTHEEWAQYGATIRRRFVKTENGLRNEVEFEEWNEAKKVFESRQTNARRTHSKRSSHAEHMQSMSTAPCNADTQTVTVTGTTTEELKELASSAIALPASPVAFTIPLTRGKTHLVTQDDVKRAEHAFPAVDVRQELRTMIEWLDAHPEKRSYSPKGAKSRIVNWMSAKQDKGGSRGTERNYSKTGGNLTAAAGAIAILEQAARNSGLADEVQPETGSGGESGDLSHLRAGSIELRSGGSS